MLNQTMTDASPLICWSDEQHGLGVDSMDATHQAMIAILNTLVHAEKTVFIELFSELYEHSQSHFSAEEVLMKESAFPAIEEHISEHRRILSELRHLNGRCQKGSTVIARAYVKDKLPEWFALHLSTMDQALAVHLLKS